MKYFIAIVLLSSMLLGCSNIIVPKNLQPQSQFLTQQQAQLRAQQVANVSYQLNYQLSSGTTFRAQTTLNFDWQGGHYPLRVDLNQAKIHKVLINDVPLYPDYNGQFLLFNSKLLQSGHNQIYIEFSRHYSTNGEGLHRFVDPVDNKVYLYSHFEPAAAQQMFPSFDQPDIKATYQLTVTAPTQWTVISATKEKQVQRQGNHNIWYFPVSPKLSTYNFSMHAGPYKVWQDNSGRYPLRLFARQSVASQIDASLWFDYTHKGLTFFDQYFGIPYPFKKYDQVLVPDFLYGAMENAAAITFAESRFLHHSTPTPSQQQRLAGVILHEMAHQWFGNLVTMKWWNGLWLNESFASFMATLATAEATEFSNAWRSFYSGGKQKAYQQDRLITSHPIEVPVASTANAFDNIDAITYNKGAAVLAQLRHLLGKEAFKKGIQQYLSQYRYRNATLDDFVSTLSKSAGYDLSSWQQQWLYQAGVDQIQADYQCLNGKITSFRLLQSAVNKDFPTLRTQKVNVSLFKLGHKRIYKTKQVTVTYQGSLTPVEALKNSLCPDLVYPNSDDWGFVQVNLDKKSFETAKRHLNLIGDPLLRSMLWQSLWNRVLSGKLSLNDYIGVLLVNAPAETDYTILGQITHSMSLVRNYLARIQPQHQDYAKQASLALTQLAMRLVMHNPQGSANQGLWFDTYIELAADYDSLNHLYQRLGDHYQLAGITSKSKPLDQDSRWRIIRQLNRYDFDNARQLITDELTRDPSDSGQKAAIAAEAIRPEAQIKRHWLKLIEQNQLPFAKLRIAMENLYPPEQRLLNHASAHERLALLNKLDKNGAVFMRSYSNSMIPEFCNQQGVSLIEHTLQQQSHLSDLVIRKLREIKQREQACILVNETIN